jgi:hypothetical protein
VLGVVSTTVTVVAKYIVVYIYRNSRKTRILGTTISVGLQIYLNLVHSYNGAIPLALHMFICRRSGSYDSDISGEVHSGVYKQKYEKNANFETTISVGLQIYLNQVHSYNNATPLALKL